MLSEIEKFFVIVRLISGSLQTLFVVKSVEQSGQKEERLPSLIATRPRLVVTRRLLSGGSLVNMCVSESDAAWRRYLDVVGRDRVDFVLSHAHDMKERD